ncbi:MAG TPA: hypothetical protein PKM55_12020 [Acidobacteriota bacterium]|nr:hypothetical protein [Acidobacteriota bacterium]
MEKLITNLRSRIEEHGMIFQLISSADNRNIFPLDFLMIASLNRSCCLLRGFCDLIQSKNFICAAPLVRLQLDNCLRIFASTLVVDPHSFSLDVLNGKRIDKIKDKTNEYLKDSYLVKKISSIYPWIPELYKHTSAYIHLSEKHILNTFQPGESKNTEILNLKMSAYDIDQFEPLYLEAIQAFEKLTEILLLLAKNWAMQKEKCGLNRT